NDKRLDLLAKALVRHADHGGQAHGRVGQQHFLELTRVDVKPPAHNHVLGAIDDVKVASLIAATDVASMEPAVRDSLGGRLRPLVVAFHYVVAAYSDLARLIGRQVIAIFVDDTHRDAPDRQADRPWPGRLVVATERRDRAGLRQTVPFQDLNGVALLERPQDLDGHSCPTRYADAELARDLGEIVLVRVTVVE